MNKTYRAGIIGLGRQGWRHFEAYRRLPEVEVCALCDINEEIVHERLNECPQARGHTDPLAFFAERLDIVSIATLAPTHAELTIAAAEARIPRILCEKPMATSVIEADAMVAACERVGSRLAINHSRRWWRPFQRLFLELGKGNLGEVRHIFYSWGGGRLGSNGGHVLDVCRMLADSEPVLVAGHLNEAAESDPRGAEFCDPGGVGQICFANSVFATVDMSEGLAVPPVCEVICTDARITIDDMSGTWVIQSRDTSHRSKPAHARYSILLERQEWNVGRLDMVQLTRSAIEELLSTKPPSCGGLDGRAAIEMTVAIHRSHQEGHSPVRLPLRADERAHVLAIA